MPEIERLVNAMPAIYPRDITREDRTYSQGHDNAVDINSGFSLKMKQFS